MFGIGFTEILVIAIAALVFFGPERLPEIAQQLGKFFVQMRRMTTDVKSGIDDAIRKAEHELLMEERAKIQKLLQDNQTKAVAEAQSPQDPHKLEHAEGLATEPLAAAEAPDKMFGQSDEAEQSSTNKG